MTNALSLYQIWESMLKQPCELLKTILIISDLNIVVNEFENHLWMMIRGKSYLMYLGTVADVSYSRDDVCYLYHVDVDYDNDSDDE